jgi:hypothetical protein
VAKLVVLVVGLVMFGLVAGLIWYLATRFERAGGRVVERTWVWRAGESPQPDSGVRVVVERVTTTEPPEVLETRDVGVVEAGSSDAQERLADLRALAQDRARTLNAQARRS